jgi:hypothetical protein
LISSQEAVDANAVPRQSGSDVIISSEELISFGTLRKQFRCGPVRMLLKLINKSDNDNAVTIWKDLPVTAIADKVLSIAVLLFLCVSN